MSNLPQDQNLVFDTELSLAAPFSGVPQLVGTLKNKPVIMLVKNQSTVPIFFADNNGPVIGGSGTTMIAGEEFVLDCRGNHGNAVNMAFAQGTSFYATGTAGTGVVKVSILYAK